MLAVCNYEDWGVCGGSEACCYNGAELVLISGVGPGMGPSCTFGVVGGRVVCGVAVSALAEAALVVCSFGGVSIFRSV
jgi:hypothetical protein